MGPSGSYITWFSIWLLYHVTMQDSWVKTILFSEMKIVEAVANCSRIA